MIPVRILYAYTFGRAEPLAPHISTNYGGTMQITFTWWHDILGMPKYDRQWHVQDIKEEYEELLVARGWIEHWSEYSDVVYTLTRARWSGYVDVQSPINCLQFVYGSVYMFPKITLRFWYYQRAAKKAGYNGRVTEIRNPQKEHKVREIADKYGIDADAFVRVCRNQLKYWPLLK